MGLGPAHAAPWTQAYPAANSVPSQGTASTSEPPRKQMLQHLVHQPCCSQALKGAAETLKGHSEPQKGYVYKYV